LVLGGEATTVASVGGATHLTVMSRAHHREGSFQGSDPADVATINKLPRPAPLLQKSGAGHLIEFLILPRVTLGKHRRFVGCLFFKSFGGDR
jgi:hypothetical protein